MMDEVILVDEQDLQIGLMPKMEAHEKGLLHRAFSIFVFNSAGEILMQQRALTKYHSAGLWSNTCCSHPKPNEPTIDAASRRLREEMGMKCELKFMFSFTYQANFDNGLVEHEFDHVYFGFSDEEPNLNKIEVNAWKYLSPEALLIDIDLNPNNYTSWLKVCLLKVIENKNN
ncbi:MAG: isopentenyl-diphosphate Delta-isomerase [Sphingobacteriaceae bacterium]|nr:isopentenyl-diphosphate Delta-isomerase [Sphingobacteriaceae bacterium]